MPSWGGVLKEINELLPRDKRALDLVRRKYIAAQANHSKRAVILYATKWTEPGANVPPNMLSISDVDIQGLMEVMHGVKEAELDLILHSPGGSIASADACVQYLRSKFKHIRVFVPQAAMSAATMIACAADEVVMGKHSFLGPIDPQLILATSLGARMIAAQAILDQFDRAKQECQDPSRLAVWLPMLQQYGPDLLVQCENVSALSKDLVREWLESYMFKGLTDGPAKAQHIAGWLANHANFKLHGKYINREVLRTNGLKIIDLEKDESQRENILSIFHAATHTFAHSGAVKIIENHIGNAYISSVQQVVMQQAPAVPPQTALPPAKMEQPPFKKKPGH